MMSEDAMSVHFERVFQSSSPCRLAVSVVAMTDQVSPLHVFASKRHGTLQSGRSSASVAMSSAFRIALVLTMAETMLSTSSCTSPRRPSASANSSEPESHQWLLQRRNMSLFIPTSWLSVQACNSWQVASSLSCNMSYHLTDRCRRPRILEEPSPASRRQR